MYIAVAHESFSKGSLHMDAGEFLLEDINAGELLANGVVRLKKPNVELKPFDASLDWNGRKILFVRPGGFGDLLFLTPCLAEIKRRWPQAIINVACFSTYQDALSGNPDVDAFEQYPIPIGVFQSYDAHVWLEGFIEKDPDSQKIHVIDLLAKRLGIEIDDKRMRFFLQPEEIALAQERYPRRKKRVGVQFFASSPVRSYPAKLMVKACRELMQQGWEVFLFGATGQINSDDGPGLVNLTKRTPPVTFRESAAILKTCDACIAPDSALCHVAGALGVPTVALYGPFPWQLRTAYALSVHAISGHGACAPCFHHSRGWQVFPKGKPCSLSGECNVLGTIEPRRIVAKVKSLCQ